MGTPRPDPSAVRQLMRLAGVSQGGQATDRELIERFVQDRSESAFADLMARHGRMVLGVCRRALRDPHAADDAFQATFLVLARKAGKVRWRESIGGWLHEVATRVARKAVGHAARRCAREGTPTDAAPEPAAPPPPPPPSDLSALQAALDEELQRLPEKLRAPVVLCHLEGLSQDDVARHLGVSDGQLRGRLYRAKEKLRENLLRRGFTLSAVLLGLAVAPRAHAVPAVLATATFRYGTSPAAIPAVVLHLAHGVIRDMSYTLKPFALLVVFGALSLGAAGLAVRSALADPSQPAAGVAAAPAVPLPKPPAPQPAPDDEKKPDPKDKIDTVNATVQAVDAAKNILRVKPEGDEDGGAPGESDVTVGAATKIAFGKKPTPLADLKPGMRVKLTYVGESNTPTEVKAAWPAREVVAKGVDVAAGKFSIETGGDDGGFEVVLALAADASVTVDHLPAGLADVPPGRKVRVDLTIDKKGVQGIDADGDPNDVPAVLKRYDAAIHSLVVELETEQGHVNRRVTLALPVTQKATVRLAGRDVGLADLKDRMPVRLRMSADRREVAGVLAGEPLPEEKDDD